MNRVRGLTGASAADMAALNAQAKQLGRTTSFSASQAGDAMGFLAQAGFEANEIIGAMPSTLQLAEASQMDLAQAADIVSNVLTGYGKEVTDLAHANDVLVKTTTSSNTNLEQMGEAMKYVAPVAAGVGLQFEETSAAIGLLGNAGIQATMAGTTLRAAITALVNPVGEAGDLLREMGIVTKDSAGKMLPLKSILKQLENSGATAAEMMTLFGKRAGPGMIALVSQGSDALAKLTGDLEDSGGAAEELAKVQMEGLKGAIKKLKSAFEGLQIALAESGLMRWITNFVTRVARWITSAAEAGKSTQKFALKILGLVAAIGPTLFMLGKLAAFIGFITSPIGLTITAIGLLVAAWVKWGTSIKTAVAPVLEWVAQAVDSLAVFMIESAIRMVKDLKFWLSAVATLPNAMGMQAKVAVQGLDQLEMKISETRDNILGLDADTSLLEEAGKKIKTWATAAAAKVAELKAKVVDLGAEVPELAGNLAELEDTILNMGESTVRAAEGFNMFETGLGPVMAAAAEYNRNMRTAKRETEELKNRGTLAMDTIESAAQQAGAGIGDAFANAITKTADLLTSLGDLAKSIFASILSGLARIGLTALFPGLGGILGARASGGPMMAGGAYWVGEKGRELIIPRSASVAVPENRISGGGTVVNNNITVVSEGITLDDPLALRRVTEAIKTEIDRINTFHGPVEVAP